MLTLRNSDDAVNWWFVAIIKGTNRLSPGDERGVPPTSEQIQETKKVNKLPADMSGSQFKCGGDTPRDASLCGSWILKEHCDYDINKYTAAIATSTCPKFCGTCVWMKRVGLSSFPARNIRIKHQWIESFPAIFRLGSEILKISVT